MLVRVTDIVAENRVREEMGDLEDLARSIKVFGLLNPLVVDSDLRLLAGGRRLEAIKLLGWEEVEVTQREGMSALERAAIELEENLRREDFTWQEETEAIARIHEIQQQLHGAARKGSNAGGWTQADTAEAIGESPTKVSKEMKLAQLLRENPELKQEKDKKKALEALARKRELAILKEMEERMLSDPPNPELILGDCTEELPKLGYGTFDLGLLDPPYGYNVEKAHYVKDESRIHYDDSLKNLIPLMSHVYPQMYGVLKENAHMFVFLAIDFRDIHVRLAEEAGFIVDPVPLIWDRGTGTDAFMGHRFVNGYDSILHMWKGRKRLNFPVYNVLHFKKPPKNIRFHPNQKPVALYQYLIEVASNPGERVIDPMCGSTTTFRACMQSLREPTGIEMNKEMFIKTQTLLSAIKASKEMTPDGGGIGQGNWEEDVAPKESTDEGQTGGGPQTAGESD